MRVYCIRVNMDSFKVPRKEKRVQAAARHMLLIKAIREVLAPGFMPTRTVSLYPHNSVRGN